MLNEMDESTQLRILDEQVDDLCVRIESAIKGAHYDMVATFEYQFSSLLLKAEQITVIKNDVETLQGEFDTNVDYYKFHGSTEHMRYLYDAVSRLGALINLMRTIDAEAKRKPQDFSFPPPAVGTSVSIDKSAKTPLKKTKQVREKKPIEEEEFRKRVFVVHGRNVEAKDAMFDFLHALSLEPIEWSYARKLTGKPTPYIGEILDAAFSHASAILILVTGDDVARLGRIYTEAKGVEPEEFTPQARPNVIFEAGIGFGRDENRVVLVELGEVREISDLAGRHTVRLDDSPDKRIELAERLESAGCDVHMENRRHWLKAGKFQAAITHPDATYEKSIKEHRKAMASVVDSTVIETVNGGEKLSSGAKVVVEIVRDGVFKDKEVLPLNEFEATIQVVWPDYEKAVLTKLCTDGIVSIEDAASGKPLVKFNKDFSKD